MLAQKEVIAAIRQNNLEYAAFSHAIEVEGKPVTVYGIRIRTETGEAAVPDITPNRQKILKFLQLLAKNQVHPAVLRELAEDFII